MNVHRFTLIVEGPDLQEPAHLEALFEAGCDDATVGRTGPVQHLDFDREAPTLADAVLDATEAVEASVPGARVVRVEPDELVTMAEIAEHTGRTRESVRLLARGERGPGGFPTPATHLKSRNRMWEWQAVRRWFADTLGEEPAGADEAEGSFIAAFNAGLRLRRAEAELSDAERRRIRRLVG